MMNAKLLIQIVHLTILMDVSHWLHVQLIQKLVNVTLIKMDLFQMQMAELHQQEIVNGMKQLVLEDE